MKLSQREDGSLGHIPVSRAVGGQAEVPTSKPLSCLSTNISLLHDTPGLAFKMGTFLIILSLLFPVLVSFVFLPRILRFLGELVGYYLRRSSRARRELLLARVVTEQRAWDAQHKDGQEKGEDEWEQIEGSLVGSAVNGGKGERDWSGIVGFFHPFWYILALPSALSR